MPIQYYIYLCLALFSIGVTGVLTRRNAIVVFMCIELMLNAVNLLLVAFSKMFHGYAFVENATSTTGIAAGKKDGSSRIKAINRLPNTLQKLTQNCC